MSCNRRRQSFCCWADFKTDNKESGHGPFFCWPQDTKGDLVGLPNHHIYLKLMIDGAVSPPFSAVTLRPGE